MKQTPQLHMRRRTLDGLPEAALPGGYAIRSYEPGDAAHWERIIALSFGREPGSVSFDRILRKDTAFRPWRVLFVVHEGSPVATASAWYNPEIDRQAGTLHFVGADPAHQGRGLGYGVSAAALRTMRDEQRARAWLSTDDERLAAIRIYLRLGFEPWLVDENQRRRWTEVFEALRRPELEERFAAILAGPLWERERLRKDHVDYSQRVVRLRRWHEDRPAGESTGHVGDARGDESLYKPSALGSAEASVKRVAAGQDQPFELMYRCGRVALRRGASVLFWMPGQGSLGAAPQVENPAWPGYIQAEAPPSAGIEILCEKNRLLSLERGENPGGEPRPGELVVGPIGVGFRIVEGALAEGDTVRLAIGKTAGFPWKRLAGRKEFKVIVDPGGGEPRMRLPEPLVVEILPLEPDRLEIFLPPSHDPAQPLRAAVTVRDRYDNRVAYDGMAAIETAGQRKIAYLCEGLGRASLAPANGAPLRAIVSCAALEGSWKSNWSLPEGERNLFFGDMHAHDFNSTAEGWPADVYRWARDEKRLDFVSVPLQTHRFIDNEKWHLAKHMNEYFLEEGRFVTFLAFEWQHSHYGDKVIHYLGGDMPYLPVDLPRYGDPLNLYEALRGADAFIVSHHPGYALDLHVPGAQWDTMETDIDRLAELWSMHGSSEGADPADRPLIPPRRAEGVMAALRQGLRLGLVAGSDTHTGRPGGSLDQPRPYWGGLCGVWAERLTRRSIFEAFRARRTYALTGARIALRFSVNGAPMGSEIAPSSPRLLAAEAWAPGPIARVQLMRNAQLLHEECPNADVCRVEFRDLDVEPAFYHCRIVQDDGQMAVCTPVWAG